MTALALLAFGAAVACSAALARPIPALVPLAVAVSLGVPAFRRPAPKDRAAAVVAVGVAVAAIAFGLSRA